MQCRDVSKVAVLLSVVFSALLATDAGAKKGGGGKPPKEDTPPGQVFFDYYEDGVTVGYTADADGNNAVVGVPGAPSYDLHGGNRWFLQWGEGSGLGKEIFAIRDDNTVTVQLTNDPNLLIYQTAIPPVWVPNTGDSAVSVIGMDVNTKESGLFKVDIDFSSDPPTPSAPSLAWPLETVFWEPGDFGQPDASVHSWSADGNLLVYDAQAGIHLADLPAGTETIVAEGSRPSISPDGTAIAFSSPDFDLALVNIDGTGEMVLKEAIHREHVRWHFWPFWSPDSNHLVWQQVDSHFRWQEYNFDVWRIKRDGTNPVNLTKSLDGYSTPTGWRSDVGAAHSVGIPEPAGALLLVLGSCGLLGNRWRRHPIGRYEADQVQADTV